MRAWAIKDEDGSCSAVVIDDQEYAESFWWAEEIEVLARPEGWESKKKIKYQCRLCDSKTLIGGSIGLREHRDHVRKSHPGQPHMPKRVSE